MEVRSSVGSFSRATAVFDFLLNNSLLLGVGAAAALVWANVHASSYTSITAPVAAAVNDVGMVFFFALMAKEVFEAALPGGPLASARLAAVPVFAAIGGMIVPAAIFVALAHATGRPELLRGWAIPCATDIAFAFLAARMIFGQGHPAIAFLLLLAIADDALGLVILAVCYPVASGSTVVLLAGLASAIALAVGLRAFKVTSFWLYLLGPGALSWWALHGGGLHPALAMVPIVPFMPHGRSDLSVFGTPRLAAPTLETFEHWWRTPVQLILLLFGLVNAGVPITGVGAVSAFIWISLLVGKPLGIIASTWLAERAGFPRPYGVTGRCIVVMGIAAGIGFTVALFFATASFPSGDALNEAKMGALLSITAFPIAVLAGKALKLRTENVEVRTTN